MVFSCVIVSVTAFLPGKGRASQMKCPKCRSELMHPKRAGKVRWLRCPGCRGALYEMDQLRRAVLGDVDTGDALNFSAASDMMDDVPAHCFRCKRDMRPRVGRDQIKLDRCDGCKSVFLDEGEVASLQLQARGA